jgi:ATP-dependent RNA helicase DHX37/DHR1
MQRHFDPVSGVQSFRVSWVSKASASQRAGRAGRTGPGHCYRLYSSPVFENYFEKFAEPEILRMPIEGIVLQMKSMNIDAVINFPFPTPPDRASLAKAEKVLTLLGALEAGASVKTATGRQGTAGGKITDLGRAMSTFPVAPRFAKMLVSGQQHGCLPYVIATVAVLAVGDPFLREEALGAEPDEELDADDFIGDRRSEISHIRSAELRQKEELRQKRKAFFQSQTVRPSVLSCSSRACRPDRSTGVFFPDRRSTTRLETARATSSACSPSSARTSTTERASASARATTSGPRSVELGCVSL